MHGRRDDHPNIDSHFRVPFARLMLNIRTTCHPAKFLINLRFQCRFSTFTSVVMILRNLLYFISALLVIGWVLGYFVWPHEGHTIHILLALALISIITGLVLSRKKGNE